MNRSGIRCSPLGAPEEIIDKLEEPPLTLTYCFLELT